VRHDRHLFELTRVCQFRTCGMQASIGLTFLYLRSISPLSGSRNSALLGW